MIITKLQAKESVHYSPFQIRNILSCSSTAIIGLLNFFFTFSMAIAQVSFDLMETFEGFVINNCSYLVNFFMGTKKKEKLFAHLEATNKH